MATISEFKKLFVGKEAKLQELNIAFTTEPTRETLTSFQIPSQFHKEVVSKWLAETNRIQGVIDKKYQELQNLNIKSADGVLVVTLLGSVVSKGVLTTSRKYTGGEIHYDLTTDNAHVIYGSIYNKWQNMGGVSGYGKPITDELPTPDGIGRFNHFTNGRSIYWTSELGAFAIYGAIRNKWESLGWEGSFLGYPISDEEKTSDEVGRYNHFQNGSIYFHPSLGTYEIHGAIRDKWVSLGSENSSLGYPITDESDLGVNQGRYTNFENGQIAWSPSSGADVTCYLNSNPSNGGLQLSNFGEPTPPLIRRLVTVTASMEITDDETFGSNEHGSANGQTQDTVANDHPRGLFSLIGKAGGEVRVEININAIASVEGGVNISGNIKLYEGESTESDDLDGTTEISAYVARDRTITQLLNVRNTAEGGDFADITLVIGNYAA